VAAARDLVVGAGTLLALRRPASATTRALLAVGTLCDAIDLAIALGATRHLAGLRRVPFPLAAGSFTVAGFISLVATGETRPRTHEENHVAR
jgi:hypothetical protein